MNKAILATSVASILFLASAGLGIGILKTQNADPTTPQAGADQALLDHAMAGDHHGLTGMERPAFAPSEGKVPTEQAARSMDQARGLWIANDGDFTPSNGVRSGSGTLEDPYVITGWYITGDLYLADTDACVEIKENFIRGQLSLNWNGQCVFVHHNYIRDLRVNENIRRDGYATGGLMEMNKIDYIGQLRHYDGEFRHNVVGPRGPLNLFEQVFETVPLPFFHDPRVANVDGFNQGIIHHNTFHGSVDLDFHGHHHGSDFFASHSHYHGRDSGRMAEHDHDHTDRWTSVFFTDNLIVDPEGWGLRYEDQAHAGDDRRAASEQEETLELDHVHHTWVQIARNTIEGAPLWVDVYHADDRNHKAPMEGKLEIIGNTVHMAEREREGLLFFDWSNYFPRNAGIAIWQAKEVDIIVADNTVTWKPLQQSGTQLPIVDDWFRYEAYPPTGIVLQGARAADIEVSGTTAAGFTYGVFAQHFDEHTQWRVIGNDFGKAKQEVWYDDSVANEPRSE
jgi:hypothetical protein